MDRTHLKAQAEYNRFMSNTKEPRLSKNISGNEIGNWISVVFGEPSPLDCLNQFTGWLRIASIRRRLDYLDAITERFNLRRPRGRPRKRS